MNLGDRLRQLRRARNLTQPELADAMGAALIYGGQATRSEQVTRARAGIRQ